MIVIEHCKYLGKTAIALVGFVTLSSTVFSAEDTNEENKPTLQESITIEEIVVTVPRSLNSLRLQLETAEDTFYSNYNDLNENDEFDVDCHDIVYTGTHLSKRECWPAFFSRLVARNAQDSLQGVGFTETIGSLLVQYGNRFDELSENIEKIANENPSVAASLVEFELLKQNLKMRREECMKKPAVLFLFRKCD